MITTETINDLQKDFLIKWFMYSMSMEERRDLMRQLPEIYNKVIGRDIVHVVTSEDQKAV